MSAGTGSSAADAALALVLSLGVFVAPGYIAALCFCGLVCLVWEG